MNNYNRLYFLILFILVGCTPTPTEFVGQTHKSETPSEDVHIPKVIFDTISKNVRSESSTIEPVYLFQPLEVIIHSENNNFLSEDHKYIFLNGGGKIDLKNILKGNGSFSFYFPEEQFAQLPELENLYFISEFPKTKIDSEYFGIGCGQWVDLKSRLSDFEKPNKVILNSTAFRHMFVAGGTYVFVFRRSNKVYLTQLYLTDSRASELKCPSVGALKKEIQNETK